MRLRVMVGVVVSKIGYDRFTIDRELFLEGTNLDPIKTHVGCV